MNPTNDRPDKPKRRWLSFGLRGLMIIVLLMSLPMGWIARDVYRSRREAVVVDAVHQAEGYLSFDYEYLGPNLELPKPPGPWLLRRLFGQHIHAYVESVHLMEPDQANTLIPMLSICQRLKYLRLPAASLNDASIETIAQMPNLKELRLIGTPIGVDQLRRLAQGTKLTSIELEGAAATDELVQLLPLFPDLEEVTLNQTTITDQAFQALGQLSKLRALNIEQAPAVTKHGFSALANCTELKELWIIGSSIDEGCVDTLKKLPLADDVYITPDELEIDEFYAWGSLRLDTLTPVEVKYEFMPICGTCGIFPPEKTGPRIIDINSDSIVVKRYDEEDVEDLPES